MKIIGKPKGVIFPKSTIDVDICNHRYGALATVTQDTDTLVTSSRYAAELFGFKHNIGLSAFINPISDTTTDKLLCEQTGRIRFDVYFPTDYWKNPNTNVIELIPDYYATAWTSAGVTAFGVTLGASKTASYPNHGQEMYTLTSGAFGYDLVGNVAGASELSELYGLCDYITTYYSSLLGRKLSCISYRNGKDHSAKMLIPKFIGARNSGNTVTGDSQTEYGRSKISPYDYLGLPQRAVTRLLYIDRACSTRWWDAWHGGGLATEALANDYCSGEITKTIANGGWFTDFIHWHNTQTANDLDALNRWFELINSTIDTNFVHRCGFGEAAEYLFFREMISRVSAYEESNKIYIVLQKKDIFKGTTTNAISNTIPIDGINVPISVKIDLTGTYLDGKYIKSSCGIRSLGSNQYIIDIPFSNKTEGFIDAILEESATTNYYNFNKPVLSSATVASQILTIVSDIPTKCVVFIAERNAAITTAILLSRDNILTTSHLIPLTTANQGKDIYIGLINKENQSILSDVYQFI